MSDTTDDMEAGAALYEAHLERIDEQVQKKLWQTKSGVVMKISDMDDDHLTNTINLLRRSAEKFKQNALNNAYQTSSMLQGEQATWDIENDIARLEESTIDEVAEEIIPHFENLMAEAVKRKLEVANA